ncbi:MAG: haloacid dehalogenase [Chloroflexota bacterium]|nr:MAG: haloacid dehalogenase [Chloroflexota bacterium]
MQGLEQIEEKIRQNFVAKNAARDAALAKSREVIRHCSLSIRALHRAEYADAAKILETARSVADAMKADVAAYPDLHYTGYVQDALKEVAEAHIVHALLTEQPIPDPDALGIDYAAYLNGLGEAATEMRRYILDIIRHEQLEHSEAMLQAMDDIYSMLVTMDFPDALTGGLRRQTDIVRGVLEKTRGDLTVAWRQEKLAERLKEFEERVEKI